MTSGRFLDLKDGPGRSKVYFLALWGIILRDEGQILEMKSLLGTMTFPCIIHGGPWMHLYWIFGLTRRVPK